MDVKEILESLSKGRPIFHSEADFQHALAWEIKLQNHKASIRLEKQVASDRRVHLDLLVLDAEKHIAIELKYKTRGAAIKVGEEAFSLRNHCAQDLGRYDFLKDISRIESYVASHPGAEGYAIFLTNDPTYWNATKRNHTVDAHYRVNEGRVISGELSWHESAKEGTTKGRKDAINIQGSYTANWSDFSDIDGQRFKYLMAHVPAKISF